MCGESLGSEWDFCLTFCVGVIGYSLEDVMINMSISCIPKVFLVDFSNSFFVICTYMTESVYSHIHDYKLYKLPNYEHLYTKGVFICLMMFKKLKRIVKLH